MKDAPVLHVVQLAAPRRSGKAEHRSMGRRTAAPICAELDANLVNLVNCGNRANLCRTAPRLPQLVNHSRTSSISSIAAPITVALRQSRRLPRHSIPSHVGSTRLLGFFGRDDEDEGELLPLSSFFFFLLSSAAAGAGAGSESASTLAVMSSE